MVSRATSQFESNGGVRCVIERAKKKEREISTTQNFSWIFSTDNSHRATRESAWSLSSSRNTLSFLLALSFLASHLFHLPALRTKKISLVRLMERSFFPLLSILLKLSWYFPSHSHLFLFLSLRLSLSLFFSVTAFWSASWSHVFLHVPWEIQCNVISYIWFRPFTINHQIYNQLISLKNQS